MKMDKQALAKHHFWIMLGVYAVLALILLVVIPIGVGSQIEDKQAAIAKMVKDLQTNSSPKSNEYLKKLDEQKDTLGGKRSTIHGEMYARQKELLVFPGDLQAKLGKSNFGDDIQLNDRNLYKDSYYLQQYEEMANSVKPTEFVGGWRAILQPVTWIETIAPQPEEIWLSLEDMCVRREVLRILHEANMMTAQFVDVTDPKAPPATKLPFRKQFKSRLWLLDLTLDRKDRDYVFSGKVKNISGRRQVISSLSLNVWVHQDVNETERAKPVGLNIYIEALAADQEVEFKDKKVTINQAPTGLYRVEQDLKLNPRFVPIKAIRNLELGRNAGHRVADRPLKMAKFSETKAAEDTTATPSSTGSSAFPGSGPSKFAQGPGMMMGGMMGGGGSAAGGDFTANRIAKTRYIDLTDQVRRMPVALVITIDQTNIDDVLVAFSNSPRMRFQNTQMHWQRSQHMPGTGGFGGAAPGTGGGDDIAGTGGPRPAMGPRPGVGPMGPGMPMPGTLPGAPGMFGGPASGSTGSLPNDQQLASLVDLTIYGIANVYERPKETGTTTPPATSPAPASPPAGAPTTTPAGTKTEPAPGTPANETPKTDKPTSPPAKPAEPTAPMPPDAKPGTPATPPPASKDAPTDKSDPKKG